MLELCIDSSSGAAVAITRDGMTLARLREDNTRRHAESLAPLVRQAARQAGLGPDLASEDWSRVNVGTGPAPFTGLRAGLMTAATLGYAWGVPVFGISSLAIIGRQVLDVLPGDREVIVATDARRKEIYWARYRALGPDAVETLDEPQVSAPIDLASHLRQHEALVVGPGALLVQQSFDVEVGLTEEADPAVLSRLVASALAEDPEVQLPPVPLYLRRPDIHGR